jgi:hypothetical protein
MSIELRNELEYLTNLNSIRLIVAKQLVEKGYTFSSFTKEADEIGLSIVTSVGIGNAIIDIEKRFVKKDKIPDLKLKNL